MNKVLIGLGLLALSASASADFDFFNNNNGEWKMGPYGPYYEENDWPEWTPMYWMQEMVDSFDDNNNNYGGMPFMNGPGYGMPMMPYGQMPAPMPYGYGQMPMMPYGQMPAPMPYGQMPMMPYGQMPAPAPATSAPGPAAASSAQPGN